MSLLGKMSKYNQIPLEEHKARVSHHCFFCNEEIKSGDKVYYQSDKFLQTLSNKKFCENCFSKYGQKLLVIQTSKKDKNQRTLFL